MVRGEELGRPLPEVGVCDASFVPQRPSPDGLEKAGETAATSVAVSPAEGPKGGVAWRAIPCVTACGGSRIPEPCMPRVIGQLFDSLRPRSRELVAERPPEREPMPRACACLDRPEEHAEFTGRRREPHAPFEARPQCAPLPEAAALPEQKIYAPIHKNTRRLRGRLSRSASFLSGPAPRGSSGGQASSVACRRMPSRSRVAPIWMPSSEETDGLS